MEWGEARGAPSLDRSACEWPRSIDDGSAGVPRWSLDSALREESVLNEKLYRDWERLSTDRVTASMAGLLAADTALNPSPIDRIASTRAMIVLSSLIEKHRLIMPDIRARLRDWAASRASAPDDPSPVQTLLLMVPMAVWLRRTNAQLLDAAAALALFPEDQPAPQLACGTFALWLRGLYVGAPADVAWRHALEIQSELVNPEWAPKWALDAIAGEARRGNPRHPVIDALRDIRACVITSGDFAQAMERAQGHQTQDLVLAVAAAAAPLYNQKWQLETLGLRPADLENWFPTLQRIRLRGVNMPRLNRRPDRTSESHPLAITGIPVGDGLLGISDFPGESATIWDDGSRTCRGLGADLQRIRDWGGTDIVSLLPADEFIDHEVTHMEMEAKERGLGFYGAPGATLDLDEPWARADRREAIAHVLMLLKRGRRPVLHARTVRSGLETFLLTVLSETKTFSTDALARGTVQSALQELEDVSSEQDEDDLSDDAG